MWGHEDDGGSSIQLLHGRISTDVRLDTYRLVAVKSQLTPHLKRQGIAYIIIIGLKSHAKDTDLFTADALLDVPQNVHCHSFINTKGRGDQFIEGNPLEEIPAVLIKTGTSNVRSRNRQIQSRIILITSIDYTAGICAKLLGKHVKFVHQSETDIDSHVE